MKHAVLRRWAQGKVSRLTVLMRPQNVGFPDPLPGDNYTAQAWGQLVVARVDFTKRS